MQDFERDLIEAVPMPLVAITHKGQIAVMNAQARALLGAGLEGRIYGLAFRQPDLLSAIETVLSGGQGGQIEVARLGSNPDHLHLLTLTALPQGALIAFEDRTLSGKADRMRRDFVANVSHELRTPLTSMMGIVETLRGPARDDLAARDAFLDIMATEGDRMRRLLTELLELSKLEAEEERPPAGRADLLALSHQVAERLAPLAEKHRVEIRVEPQGVIPEITAEPDQMVQVLTNLVENAVKYGAPSGSAVRVLLAPEQGPRGPVLRLSVIDAGEGIDPRHIPRLTERFYRVDGHRSRAMGGTGLGLAIVKHIIGRHRGRFTIESEKGVGSCFSAIFPLNAG